MDTPEADIEVSEPLVRRLLRDQHPDLADLPLRLVTNGWDNVLYRLGDELVVRLPRRTVAAQLVENEQRWLPEFAARVTVPIPAAVRIGTASDAFPWHWTVAPWFEGDLGSTTPFDELGSLAAELASFVSELHVPAARDAPFNPVRGVPLAARDQSIVARLATGIAERTDELMDVWRRAVLIDPWAGEPLWLHGDLHPANILTCGGHLAAVLDFGDLTGGDPATDLATAWLTFDPQGRERFMNALDYDDATWQRAIGWAISLGSAALMGNSAMQQIGRHGLEQVLLSQS
jgi:aminoglycoside phosphotransferase (APT) family kinase protein